MKKAILFVIGLIILSAVTNAQQSAAKGGAYDLDTRLINVGLGVGSNYYGFSKSAGAVYRHFPAICISYEQAYAKKLGPGFLGIGALVTFQNTLYRSEKNYYGPTKEYYYYQHRYSNYVIAARAAYHWDGLIADNAEVYGGAIAGLRFQTYNYTSNYPGDENDYRANSGSSVMPVVSVFAGARWYFVPRVALYGELSGGLWNSVCLRWSYL
jgi:hypothetical protein